MTKQFFALTLAVAVCTCAVAQQRSPKRGVCWDEKTQQLTENAIGKMAPGVAWVYNWGFAPNSPQAGAGPDGEMDFLPMSWNDDTRNLQKLYDYLDTHPGVKYLLGYNEPNFASQANMTPQQAAESWPLLEQIAEKYGLQLVAPALNFTGESVGGRTWSPFEWYDEFFRLRPNAKIDYLCMHCYMNWAENVDWIATRYFYTDDSDDNLFGKNNKGKYPHLQQYLANYKDANGHFPKMFLTEFCSWEDGVTPYRAGLTADFQMDQMTQKLQLLELSDMVEGYAWFMANPGGGENEHPHESIFQTNTPGSQLSELGKVYVYMSAFDRHRFYAPGEPIAAKDYVNASLGNQQVKVRSNTDTMSDVPLQVEFPKGAWAAWQVDVPADGTYVLTLRIRSATANTCRVYCDRISGNTKLFEGDIPSADGQWKDDQTVNISLPQGQHTLFFNNKAGQPLWMSQLQIDAASNESTMLCVQTSWHKGQAPVYYSLQGFRTQRHPHNGFFIKARDNATDAGKKGIFVNNGKKVVVE